MFKVVADLPISKNGVKQVIPAGSLVKLRPDQAESLLKKGCIKVVCQGEEIGMPELCSRLARMTAEETDLFNESYELFRREGMGMDSSAFLAFCELKD